MRALCGVVTPYKRTSHARSMVRRRGPILSQLPTSDGCSLPAQLEARKAFDLCRWECHVNIVDHRPAERPDACHLRREMLAKELLLLLVVSRDEGMGPHLALLTPPVTPC